jgi:dolichol-phosphate mannosyltransferase
MTSSPNLTPVTVIVPLFNEEESVPQLADAMQRLRNTLVDKYAVHFILVDDGSTDVTAERLLRTFGTWNSCDIVQHAHNQGIAAAIRTGLRNARTEIVCSIDADCSYDPVELAHMIPLLTADVDLVTASPYHPDGVVRNLPAWRLTLSRGASFLYRRVLGRRLHTFTSCFRVYRRSAVQALPLKHQGFQGVAELLARLALRGSNIVEYPTVLDVRRFGQSKLKVWQTIGGHLELLGQLLLWRMVPSMASGHASESLSTAFAGQAPHLERTTA